LKKSIKYDQRSFNIKNVMIKKTLTSFLCLLVLHLKVFFYISLS